MLTILSFFPIPPLAAGASAVDGILYMAADHDVFMGIICLGGGISMGAGRFAAYALGSGKYLALGQVANQIQIYAGRITAGLGFVQGGRSSWDQANWIAEQEDASVLDYLDLIATFGGTELSAYFLGAGVLWPEAASGKQMQLTEGGTGSNLQNPLFGDDWHRYFNEKYGASNVTWENASINDIIDMPSRVVDFSPEQVADLAPKAGWSVEPLGKGSLKGIPFEQGGGLSMRAPKGSSLYIQYHPGGDIMAICPISKFHPDQKALEDSSLMDWR